MTDRSALLPTTLCPDRTFALVVGIEQYEVAPGWNLRGAARDALRFAEWLTGCGEVPPDNVHLLLSPLDPQGLDWSASPVRAALASRCRPATEANVTRALLAELAQCDGDMLWIYWAGHGFVDARRELLLPCADAHEGQIRHVNLDSALNWLRTDMVRNRRFPLQAALVDTCRIDVPRDGSWNFGSTDYGGGTLQPGRRQFQLYAARRGEAAGNNAEREAGQFTEVLLDELAGRSLPECVEDLAEIGRAVHARFVELRRTEAAWQQPEFIRDRDWDACSFLDDESHTGSRAVRLDQTAWDELGAAFAGRALPRHTYDAYAWAFKVADCATPFNQGLPGDSLIDVASDLDERQGRRPDLPLTLPFVRFLGERAAPTDSVWAAQLRAWVERTRQRQGVPALPPVPVPARISVLHLRLDPAVDGDDVYLARMWLRRDDNAMAIWESESRPLRLDEVRDALSNQLKRAESTFSDEGTAVDRVEFHVPFELLEVPFDEWAVSGRRPGRTRPLGLLYQVVVRCPEERQDARAAWGRKWLWLQSQGGRHPKAVRVVLDAQVNDTLGISLGQSLEPGCVVAGTSSQRTSDALDAVLEGGVPVAVWWRSSDSCMGGPEGELNSLLAPDEHGTPTTNVMLLPRRVHDLRLARAETAAGASNEPDEETGGARSRLALLWDDPDHTMEVQSLRASPTTDPSQP